MSLSGSKAAVDVRFPNWTTVVHLLRIEDVGGVNMLVFVDDDDDDGL